MRVYHFVSADHGLTDIRRQRLKIATLRDINDPFELTICCNDAKRRQVLRSFRNKWAERFGMLCFSRDWRNPVQWSHYADKHRGICLGFDVPDELLVPVRYTSTPVTANWSVIEEGGQGAEREMMRWLSTKFRHWSYEQEMRSFVRLSDADERGLYFCNFGNRLRLREIIIGPESSVSRMEVEGATNGQNDLRFFKSRLAFKSYRVVKQLRSDMWDYGDYGDSALNP